MSYDFGIILSTVSRIVVIDVLIFCEVAIILYRAAIFLDHTILYNRFSWLLGMLLVGTFLQERVPDAYSGKFFVR